MVVAGRRTVPHRGNSHNKESASHSTVLELLKLEKRAAPSSTYCIWQKPNVDWGAGSRSDPAFQI